MKDALMRNAICSVVENCKNAYSVGEYYMVDEILKAFRVKCSFSQFIPSKSNKNLWVLEILGCTLHQDFLLWHSQCSVLPRNDIQYHFTDKFNLQKMLKLLKDRENKNVIFPRIATQSTNTAVCKKKKIYGINTQICIMLICATN